MWDHFTKFPTEPGRVICNHCTVKIKTSGNTSNLHNHLRVHNIDVEKIKQKSRTSTEEAPSQAFTGAPTQGEPRQKRARADLNDVSRQNRITTLLITWLCVQALPFSTVDCKSFKNLIAALDPNYVLPNRNKVSDELVPELHLKVSSYINGMMEKVSDITLTTDSWTTKKPETVLALTGHFIDQNLTMRYTIYFYALIFSTVNYFIILTTYLVLQFGNYRNEET